MKDMDGSLGVIDAVLRNYRVEVIVQDAKRVGWEHTWQEFKKTYDTAAFKSDDEKNVWVDLFLSHCLKEISPVKDSQVFWEIIEHWCNCRKLENRTGALSQDEKVALIHFVLNLRVKMQQFIVNNEPKPDMLSDHQQRLMISVWRQLFFEPFSALNLFWHPKHKQQKLDAECKNSGYAGLLVASMYQPFAADKYDIDAEKLITAPLPLCYKSIIIYWMLNTPYFNAEEQHRQKLMRYVPELCRAITKHPEILSTAFFLTFVQEVMTGFWRASYIGGNNVKALSAFGDFISFIINRLMPPPKPKLIAKNLADGDKLRIGYISRNFYKQAVSCYMVNRVIHHDNSKFEVYIFALGDYHDNISELFKQHSYSFERFTNMTDFHGIAKSILEKKLDILIYTDIGMDPVTYILSGLQLAPIQCAMVGHGTTTGMPTIQYYISGDFEAPSADNQYREKLIRLPNLGAAQYMPIVPEEKLTREELGIPEDAVVFISCANGIKHGHLRDALFVEILKQAPHAWVVLKPFATHSSIDREFSGRIASAAREAGVGNRLLILPPFGQTRHVMGLLAIADVQLDSYPYGGWTTNMEALYMGLPIVTQQGELARSRWGAGMLKALEISEGLAANEEEYVAWAVRFAQDAPLRQRLKEHIKARVQDVLFDGTQAQPAFEDALLKIYREECRHVERQEQFIAKETPLTERQAITIATSLCAIDYENQRKAISSWEKAGFKIVSINTLEEIAVLYPLFPDVTFVAATREAGTLNGESYIYYDDILAYFSTREEDRICGIISPDIHLIERDFYPFIEKEAVNSFVFGSRVDVDSLSAADGNVYGGGFDYFFFDRKVIPYYPQQEFCLGLPWCDYWAVVVPLMHHLQVKKLTSPIAIHVKHPVNYTKEIWTELGGIMAQHFRPPFDLTPETMPKYAEETLTIINKLSKEVSL